MMRIGILGGTFDPIHNGHLYLAEEAIKKLNLDKIVFIPTYLTPHKSGSKITHTEHRYNMARLAIAGRSAFELSDIEIKRKGKSYSIDTLRQLNEEYGRDAEMYFITGSDALRDLDKWKDLDGILKLSRFVLARRPGFVVEGSMPGFVILDIDAKDISASDIRRRIRDGLDITGLVPGKVRNYIETNRLYKG
ncbi:MAG: nicotinate-nucleotide adenylyltransferase [Candidatus Omnitrophica bacterium]|nr:nicotinate-nucleotide adenylyltransferase [Candidatus Omnitrophota bacterium]